MEWENKQAYLSGCWSPEGQNSQQKSYNAVARAHQQFHPCPGMACDVLNGDRQCFRTFDMAPHSSEGQTVFSISLSPLFPSPFWLWLFWAIWCRIWQQREGRKDCSHGRPKITNGLFELRLTRLVETGEERRQPWNENVKGICDFVGRLFHAFFSPHVSKRSPS